MNTQVTITGAQQLHTSNSIEVSANLLYDKAKGQGFLGQLKKLFSKSNDNRLITFPGPSEKIQIHGKNAADVKKVPINKILGTVAEGRKYDFDNYFRPLQQHNKERWLGVAAARLSGRRLGPVNLLKVEDVFFVEDGHHRISVAKALGEVEIEANVMVISITGKWSMLPDIECTNEQDRLVLRPVTV